MRHTLKFAKLLQHRCESLAVCWAIGRAGRNGRWSCSMKSNVFAAITRTSSMTISCASISMSGCRDDRVALESLRFQFGTLKAPRALQTLGNTRSEENTSELQ